MRQLDGIERQHEISRSRLLRDTRPMFVRILEGMGSPFGLLVAGCALAITCVAAPALADVCAGLALLYLLVPRRKDPAREIPFRLPQASGLIDPNDIHPATGKPQKARGQLFVGNRVSDNAEIWESFSDVVRHWFVLGATGAGKTELLVSMVTNAVIWGSGFAYIDAKGDVSLFAKVFSLCRMFGREDDLLVLNFMTGNADTSRKTTRKLSNTYNPFIDGNASSNTQMLVNLMDAGGEGKGADIWKGRAIAFISSIMPALVDKRDAGGILLDVGKIREYMPVLKLAELMRDPEVRPENQAKIQAFLYEVPGYNKSKDPGQQSNTFYEQYGYQIMQFTRILSSLADTYGHIFKAPLADVDMRDVVINRRVLVAMLPALETSGAELSNLGKIVMAGLKRMMGGNLGNRVEGTTHEVLDARATNAPSPFPIVCDEHGVFLVPGDTAVLWGQARSLGAFMVSAGQDVQAYYRASREETKAIIANCITKVIGKLEDPAETFELVEKLGGRALISTLSDYERDFDGIVDGARESQSVRIERVERITLQDLQRQIEGEVHILVSGNIIRARVFFADPPRCAQYRINHMVKVLPPGAETIERLRIDVSGILDALRDPDQAFAQQRPADTYFAYVGELLERPHVHRYMAMRQGAELGAALLAAFVEAPSAEPLSSSGGGGSVAHQPAPVVSDVEAEEAGSVFDANNLPEVPLGGLNAFQAWPVDAPEDMYAELARASAPAIEIAFAVEGSGLFNPPPGTERVVLDANQTRDGLAQISAALGSSAEDAIRDANTMVAVAATATSYPEPPKPERPGVEALGSTMAALEALLEQSQSGGSG